MRKFFSLAVVLFVFVSCSAKKEMLEQRVEKVQNNLSDLPEWVVKPGVENGVAAVGIASPSRGGLQSQIGRAELDGKAKIAAKIQSEISEMTKRALREANVNGVNDVEEVFTQATKEVVKNMPLSGVERIAMYRDSEGFLYVHMMLRGDYYSRYMQNNKKIYEERLDSADLSRDNLNKSQEAVKSLFEELETELSD